MSAARVQQVLPRIQGRFERLYGSAATRCMQRFEMLMGRYGVEHTPGQAAGIWSETDAMLITYPDMIQADDTPPLDALRRFLAANIGGAFSTLHLLPFFPSSSDDGFSVIDYRKVDSAYGDWTHIRALSEKYRIACDVVLNHASRASQWFEDFCAEIAPARDYFITADRSANTAAVVRPRTHPLLTPVSTRGGVRHVWTTFSADQIDLNYANPDVLFEMLDIALFYIAHGVRILRLDAVGYLWKHLGTPCIHLPETHEIVKLIRDMLNALAPAVWLLTETNVPHSENIGYFGAGDEAHLVYQFSLPPLVLASLIMQDATYLSSWASALESPPTGCTFLNFSASHDGIGMRPLEGLVPASWAAKIVKHVESRQGTVSYRNGPAGAQAVYELNVSYFDALRGAPDEHADLHLRRFLCSQLMVLALQGIPAVYFHSLCATPNCHEEAARTGRARSINRRKYKELELRSILANPSGSARRVLNEYLRSVRLRAGIRAFHPEAAQRVLAVDPRIFAIERTHPASGARVLALSNCSAAEIECALPAGQATALKDVLSGKLLAADAPVRLSAYQTVWLVPGDTGPGEGGLPGSSKV